MEAMSVLTKFVDDASLRHQCHFYHTSACLKNRNEWLVGSDAMFCPFNSFYNSHQNFMVPIFENVAVLFFFTYLVFFTLSHFFCSLQRMSSIKFTCCGLCKNSRNLHQVLRACAMDCIIPLEGNNMGRVDGSS